MATSERIFATPSSASHVQPLPRARMLSFSGQLLGLRALLDLGTIFIGLVVSGFVVRAAAPAVQAHQETSRFAVALMGTALLAFANTYPRRRTPLDIAATEGLVRAVSLLAVLLAIANTCFPTAVPRTAILSAGVVAILLLIEREATTVFFGRRQRLRQSNSAPSNAFFTYCSAEEHATSDESHGAYIVKRIVDILGAATLLILALPLGLAVATLIKLDSKGPVFLRQKRIGRRGVPFYMWKFRSMHVGVARYARSPVCDSDPRLTRLGRGLRRLSLDELPQLLNVFRGDMSLVGPRPEMPFIVKDYTAFERLRLNATPGITGLWQISPARALPIHQHLELDLFYIEHRSFFLDTAILLRTVTAVVRGIGAL